MKLSFVATLSAIALAVTSEAAESALRLYNLDNTKGNCRSFPIRAYDTCYTISEFYLPRSASFVNNDPHKSKLSVTFYETGNCGGKWTRASGPMKNGIWNSWGKLGSVHSRAGSVLVHGAETSNGDGKIDQYKPAVIADWYNSC
ncbi:hypothetical protein DFQ27_000352 [Actinomortierella ambigua]|uniref:Secreted protein n=1 Tax=Actinomortierella ambigua TaxID=1343610 RepID=A0A9P6PL30_9FUNG|nr:hypothetical protein DFQ26_003399 [Actinomortierella ambigua]KAG0249120.1 hypothetical protein DFQ27_000352 [Actinomortierella ambigua]